MIHFENEFLRVEVLERGATLYSIQVRGQDHWREILLQYEDMDLYQTNPKYMNCLCGYHAGRVKEAHYLWQGKRVLLDANSGLNHLHGGKHGLHTLDFEAKPIQDGVHLQAEDHLAHVEVTFQLVEADLKIHYQITPKDDLLINPTQHFYFKLDDEANVNHQWLQIPAKKVMAVDEFGVPNGHWIDVDGTAFDFQEPTKIGDKLNQFHTQFATTGFIDHAFKTEGHGVILRSDKSKIEIALSSDASMHVVYLSNKPNPKFILKNHGEDSPQVAVAIEPQECPNGVNLAIQPLQVTPAGNRFERQMTLSVKTL